MWGEAYGGWGHNSGDGNAAGMHHSVGGFILGADTPVFGTWRVGGLVSYGHSAFDVGGRDSSGHSNTVSVGGYAGTHWGRLALRIGATYSWDMLGMNRQVAFAGYSSRESSAYMGARHRDLAILVIASMQAWLHWSRSPTSPMSTCIPTGSTNMVALPRWWGARWTPAPLIPPSDYGCHQACGLGRSCWCLTPALPIVMPLVN